MIQAVIFDCFGVLTTDGWLAFKQRYLAPASAEEAEATELNRQADAGLLSQSEFIDRIAALAQVEKTEALRMIDGHVRNDLLFDYVKDQLKPHYKIGLLSNAAENYTSELFLPWQVELFDEMTFSFELGAVKPDQKMYETIAAKLGVLPEECVFIDDREVFVEGAQRVGMQAICFTSNDQCRQQLSQLLERHA